MANVIIDVAAEFTGKKAFKEAETAADKLNNSVKGLAKGLASVYTAQKILSYAKASVKAFTEDDKAARTLTKTLNNLGLQFADPAVKAFISDLERQYNVLDDLLRPAYQKLVTGTGDWRKSQELLKTALDLSAQSGFDVVTVAEDLVNAYIGNTKGLRKYTLGLSAAQLSGMKFEAILEKIAAVSKGQASAAADTYAGKMDKLTIVVGNLSEAVGESLIDSFANLAGNGDLDKSISKLEKFGQTGIGLFRLLTGADSLSEAINSLDYRFGIIPTERTPNTNRSKSPAGTAQRLAAEKKAEAEALKRAREAAKAAKDKAAAEQKALQAKRLGAAIDKANLALNKSSDVFDMDKIQVAAALKNQAEQLGKATDATQLLQIANDTARLNVKKAIFDLDAAIASGDEAAIIKATTKLNEELKILGAVTGQKIQMAAIETILKGLSPKELIDQKNLNDALEKIRQMIALLAQVKTPTLTGVPTTTTTTATATATDTATKVITETAVKIASDTAAKVATETALKIVQTDNGIKVLNNPRTTEQINKTTEELGGVISVIGENGKEFTKLIDGMAQVFQTMEDSGAFNALVNSFASGTINSFNAGSFRSAEGGSIFSSGAVGSRDKNFTITVNTGVGDPNAIAEAISNVLREAQDRGTLTAV